MEEKEYQLKEREKIYEDNKNKFDQIELFKTNDLRQPLQHWLTTLDISNKSSNIASSIVSEITEKLKSSSVSEHINDNEADPATSSNKSSGNLKPIQPLLKTYPKSNGRSFSSDWFKKYNWLEYSE